MLFNSWGYLLFLLLAVGLHWTLRKTLHRTVVLGLFSVLFYAMWRWEFTLLVLFSAMIDFVASRRIHASEDRRVRRSWLLLSLIVNLGLLVFFKYTYFIYDNIQLLGAQVGADLPDIGLKIILPLGISFYTFQTICYTIDVYRRVIEPSPRFWTFLTYVTFWPQLIAGPVLRAPEVIPQLEADRRFDRDAFLTGVQLVIVGLFKKVVLADSISGYVDEAFAMNTERLTAIDVWVANFLFGFQIYFDFAGYSTIAIGSALLVGMVFPKNFNWPYMSRSPREFWQRWHISLSAWIRDYLYLPLTGQKFRTRSTGGIAVATEGASSAGRTRALFLTWFIMGLWHGAAWTFALWGLYHATLITLYRLVKPLRALPDRFPVVAWGLMLLLGMGGWISFRAQSLDQAVTMFGKILDPRQYGLGGRQLDVYQYFWAFALTVGMTALWLLKRRHERRPFPAPLQSAALGVSMAGMVALLLMCLRIEIQFIYFQF